MIDVEQKKQETNALIDTVQKESSIANEEKEAADIEEEKTNIAAAEANKLKDEAEKSLAAAIPALEQAQAAIDCMKKGHIGEMKALGTPPPMVIMTAKCILILLGEKIGNNDPDDKVWKKGAQVMNNPDKFLTQIKSFNGENIE